MKKQLRLISEGSGKTVIALALVSLLALPIFCLYAHHAALAAAHKDARMQAKEITQRATVICATLGPGKASISEPQFFVQRASPPVSPKPRHLWLVDCLVDAHRYNLIFNDVTGNIESMYADGLSSSSRATATFGVAVNSSSDAVEGAVRRLKDLQMVPKGTRIALVQRPECDQDGLTWRMVWNVLPPNATKPYAVRVVLNGCDATPMMVVNYNERDRYAQF